MVLSKAYVANLPTDKKLILRPAVHDFCIIKKPGSHCGLHHCRSGFIAVSLLSVQSLCVGK